MHIDIEIALSAFPKITSTLNAHKASPQAFQVVQFGPLEPNPKLVYRPPQMQISSQLVGFLGRVSLDSTLAKLLVSTGCMFVFSLLSFWGPIGQYGLAKHTCTDLCLK